MLFYHSLRVVQRVTPYSRCISTVLERKFAIKEFVYQPAVPNAVSPLTPLLKTASSKDIEYVVVMFGWLCAPFRPLVKYTSLNNRLGLDVLVYQPPSKSLLWPFYGYKLMRSRIEELHLYSQSRKRDANKDVRYLFHVLSNQGCYHYAMFCEELRRQNLQKMLHQCAGSAIDSAPSKTDTEIFSKAFIAGYFAWFRTFMSRYPTISGSVIGRLLGANRRDAVYEHAIVGTAFRFLVGFLKIFHPNSVAYMRAIDKAVDDLPVEFPHLYIYSEHDPLIPSDQVKAHIIQQKGRHADNTECVFTDEAHVASYRLHPDEYAECLSKFWEKCIQKNQN